MICLNMLKKRTVNIWNSLPNHVVLAESSNSFKSHCDNNWKNRRLFIIFNLKSREPECEARLVVSYNFSLNVYNIGI